MSGYNKVVLMGRLGIDPELKAISETLNVVNFSLATSKKVKGEEVTQWHKVVAFNKTADLISTYLTKGSQCLIEGELQYRSYDKDGEKKYITEIVASNVQFIGTKTDVQTTNVVNSAPSFDNFDEKMPF